MTSTDSAQTKADAIDPAWLEPTWFLDSDSPEVEAYATRAVGGATDPTEQAVRLFHSVRDGIRYDPYISAHRPDSFRASTVAGSSSNWCVPKSVLLAAAARSRGIPARLGFADVRNHLTSEKLQESMGTDLFMWHGYAELRLSGRWFKLSSAFNIELCQKFGTRVLEFDGTEDALMHSFDAAGNRHMEYVNQRGSFSDLPLDLMQADFAEFYPNWQETSDGGGPTSAAEAGDSAFE